LVNWRDCEPTDVLLLGTYHMANPGRDLINLRVDDVLAYHRQAELEDLAARLAHFHPTKVCVEHLASGQAELDIRYASYLAGTAEPGRNEVWQLGFRVARLCGLERVWAIDDAYPMAWEGLQAYFEREPEEARAFEAQIAAGQRETEEQSERLLRMTIGEFLREMNGEDALRRNLSFYIDLLRIGDSCAADMALSWYGRNLRIFSNLAALTGPGDRIFVLFGQGHIPILRHLTEVSSRHRLVSVEGYL